MKNEEHTFLRNYIKDRVFDYHLNEQDRTCMTLLSCRNQFWSHIFDLDYKYIYIIQFFVLSKNAMGLLFFIVILVFALTFRFKLFFAAMHFVHYLSAVILCLYTVAMFYISMRFSLGVGPCKLEFRRANISMEPYIVIIRLNIVKHS